jgi:hypothetical protein
MPKPLNVDWPAVRVLAVAVGVREAARQMQISQDAVRQRSKREGWMASPKTVAQLDMSYEQHARGTPSRRTGKTCDDQHFRQQQRKRLKAKPVGLPGASLGTPALRRVLQKPSSREVDTCSVDSRRVITLNHEAQQFNDGVIGSLALKSAKLDYVWQVLRV